MGGGAERQMVLFLRDLDRERFDPTLCLLSSANADYLEDLPPDIPVVDLHKERAADLLKVTGRLAGLMRKGDFDVAYSRVDYTNFVTVVASMLARRGTPTVVVEDSVQSLELAQRRDRRVREALVAWTYRHATAVVAPTEGVRREVAELARRPLRVLAVIPNMVDVPAAREAARAEPPPDLLGAGSPLLVAAGRLDSSKAFDTLLAAAALLGRRRDFRLVILGKGPELAKLREIARAASIEDRVVFAGFVANPFSVLSRADVVVCSSRRESFGNVLVEAMALGRPIVSTAAPYGPAEIMVDGVNGLVAAVDDPSDLAAKIEQVLEDEELARSLSKGAAEHARLFDSGSVKRRIEALLESAAPSRRSA